MGDLGARYRVEMAALLGDAVKGGLPLLFTLDLLDSTGTAFSSVALPTSQPPSLASFDSREWRLGFFTGGSTVVGTLGSLTVVPLPPAALLFLPGLLGLGGAGSQEPSMRNREARSLLRHLRAGGRLIQTSQTVSSRLNRLQKRTPFAVFFDRKPPLRWDSGLSRPSRNPVHCGIEGL